MTGCWRKEQAALGRGRVPAGIYFLRLDCPSGVVTRSLMRL